MPNYLLYRDDLETPESDEQETQQKLIDVMTAGMHLVREKSGSGENVRISHAKAFGLLQGELRIQDDHRR